MENTRCNNLKRAKSVSILLHDTYKASAVFAEGWFNVCGLNKGVYEAHLTVEQRTGLHKVINHLVSADLSIPKRWRKTEYEMRVKNRHK